MVDDLDRALIHALQLAGRAPYSRIADVLGVSTQTVARRYQRLRAEAGLRVVGLPDPHRTGRSQWLVRLTTTPRATQSLAATLARRPDTTWIKLASGGTELVAILQTTPTTANPLLLHDLPATPTLTSLTTHHLLHLYRGGPTPWPARAQALTPPQSQAFTPVFGGDGSRGGPGADIREGDGELLAGLGEDGRVPVGELARRTGWAVGTVARRLGELEASGAIYYDVDVDPTALGITTSAMLWFSVPPAAADRVGRALAEHDELAFVAATTGRTNLVAHALCASPAALHTYLTERVGAIEQITALETVPILRTVKSAAPNVGLRV